MRLVFCKEIGWNKKVFFVNENLFLENALQENWKLTDYKKKTKNIFNLFEYIWRCIAKSQSKRRKRLLFVKNNNFANKLIKYSKIQYFNNIVPLKTGKENEIQENTKICLFESSFVSVLAFAFAGGEGITIGAHRLYSHKSFKATFILRVALIILQTIAGQVSIKWHVPKFRKKYQKYHQIWFILSSTKQSSILSSNISKLLCFN